jgi:hypothetical protein
MPSFFDQTNFPFRKSQIESTNVPQVPAGSYRMWARLTENTGQEFQTTEPAPFGIILRLDAIYYRTDEGQKPVPTGSERKIGKQLEHSFFFGC